MILQTKARYIKIFRKGPPEGSIHCFNECSTTLQKIKLVHSTCLKSILYFSLIVNPFLQVFSYRDHKCIVYYIIFLVESFCLKTQRLNMLQTLCTVNYQTTFLKQVLRKNRNSKKSNFNEIFEDDYEEKNFIYSRK